jgi:hypothetical protein
MSSNGIVVEQYTEKSLVVLGNSEPYKEQLKELGGKWNSSLKSLAEGKGTKGWIFPLSKREKLEELCKNVKNGTVKATPTTTSSSSKGTELSVKEFVPLKDYLSLLTRVERLEQQIIHLGGGNVKSVKKEEVEIEIDSSDSEEEEEEKPVERLKHKYKNKK